MDFYDWIQVGIDNGWASKPICATHDGLPMDEEEEAEWEEGLDPCVTAVRVYEPSPTIRLTFP